MNRKRLSLCMIAKNEAENISRCISSLRGLADEIIVVDTGSMDRTADIALSQGAKVISMKWEDDFSKARNLSLDHAQGDWVLCLDCDEELYAESLLELEKLINTEGPEAYFIQIVNTTAEGMELTVPGLRLFRNRKEYRFTGCIHEQILPAIVQHCDQSRILPSNVLVHHSGYNQKLTNISAKIQRNMRILESIPEEKRDGFYFYNLGTEYLRLCKREEALAHFIKSASLTHPGQGYGPIMIKRMITLLFELGKYKKAGQYLEHYRAIYKDYNDLVLLTGICHYMCGRYSEAGNIIKEYLALPSPPQWYPIESAFITQTPQELIESAVQHAVIRDYPVLSICIIGNNEAATLATCIKSVNEIASQVVYVDTGSTDLSREIAFELGAEVYSVPWAYDFSAIRNYALDQAQGEWILVLDADEVLPETSVMPVIRAIKSESSPAYLVKVNTPLDQNQSAQNWQLSGSVRLYRSKMLRYQGVLAEELLFEGSNPVIEPEPISDLEIVHLHFQSPLEHISEKRKIWEETILREWSEDIPVIHFLLGKEAFYAQEIQKAAEYFSCYFQAECRNESAAFYYYTMSLINSGQYEQAIKIAEEAQKAFPDYTDLFYLTGIAYGLTGQVKEAEGMMLECLKMGEAAWWKYLCSPGTGHYKALLSLGTIYVRQGRLQEAVNVFLQAAKIPQSSEQAIVHLAALQGGLSFSIDILLKNQGLFNWRNTIIVAQTFAKMGNRMKSWECLRLLDEQTVDQPEFLDRMIGLVETVIFNVKGQLLQHTPDHPILKYV
ncbi:MAG: glycosyltransferase [Syntrophomonas sp.]|nr:glycosyltransferase [Syntrophomonas sp.]